MIHDILIIVNAYLSDERCCNIFYLSECFACMGPHQIIKWMFVGARISSLNDEWLRLPFNRVFFNVRVKCVSQWNCIQPDLRLTFFSMIMMTFCPSVLASYSNLFQNSTLSQCVFWLIFLIIHDLYAFQTRSVWMNENYELYGKQIQMLNYYEQKKNVEW